MMGFTKNGFVVSSAALGIKNPDNEKEDDTDLGDEKEDFLEGKYMNDFLNNFQKEWLEIPNNLCYFIDYS